MPTSNSTGITASLVVAELAGTLSDGIELRMGADQREDAERIKHQLLHGCTLEERAGPNHSMVGVLQFVGDERDMALFVVEAGCLTNLGSQPMIESTCITQSLDDTNPTSKEEVAQEVFTRKKKTGNSKRSSHHNETALTTPTPKQKQTPCHAITFDKPLALSLKVEYADFIRRKDMRGKDLKIEVFLNGQLMDVTFESLRHTKARGDPLYSGQRVHRQAEKPWIYVPDTASSNNHGVANKRWANISQALEEEASQRGTDQSGQRPISAQFLIALARMQLLDSIGAKSENFAVIDVIITAGKGHKHGAETSYITSPTRLFDSSFSGFAPVDDDFGQYPDPNGYLAMQDAFTRMPFGSQGSSNSQPSVFLDTQMQPSALMDAQYPEYPEHQMPPPPSPHTPKPGYKGIETYRKLLEGTPLKRRLPNYENAHGRIRGRRTLKQRLGDMSKMSPKKRIEVMNELKNELDEETLDTIKRAFNIECLDPTTPPNKKMQASSEVLDFSAVNDNDDVEIDFDQYINAVETIDPYNVSYSLPPPQPQFLQDSSPFSCMPDLFPEEETFQQMMPPPSNQWFAPSQQMMMPPPPTPQWLGTPQQPAMQPSQSQTQESIPPTTPLKKSKASALSNSPMHVPVKKWPAQMKRDAAAANSEKLAPRPLSGAPTTPQAQRIGMGSKRSSGAWLPREQKYEEVLRDFKIPDLCVGSAVSYADGTQQRQVPKARSGDFEEREFVVGMRFAVL